MKLLRKLFSQPDLLGAEYQPLVKISEAPPCRHELDPRFTEVRQKIEVREKITAGETLFVYQAPENKRVTITDIDLDGEEIKVKLFEEQAS